MASLQNIPYDIKYLILNQITDIGTFNNLVGASPSFKDLFHAKRKYFLTSLLDRAIHKDVQREALFALQASMMLEVETPTRLPAVKEFLSGRYPETFPSTS